MSKVPNLVHKPTEPIVKSTSTLLGFKLRGTAPLIMNRFSDKAVEQMLAKHMGRDTARTKKVPRDVIEQATQYNVAGAVAMPSTAFKQAMLTGASALKSFAKNKVPLRVGMFVKGASVPIVSSEMIPRMDIVRLSGIARDPDVRFRPMFPDWSARIVILFDESVMARDTIIDLVDRAGRVGIGEWRPETNGDHGTFEIEALLPKEEIPEVLAICAPIIRPVRIPEWALDAEIDLEDVQKILTADKQAAGKGEV